MHLQNQTSLNTGTGGPQGQNKACTTLECGETLLCARAPGHEMLKSPWKTPQAQQVESCRYEFMDSWRRGISAESAVGVQALFVPHSPCILPEYQDSVWDSNAIHLKDCRWKSQ